MNKEHNYTMIQVLHAGLFEKKITSIHAWGVEMTENRSKIHAPRVELETKS